MAYDFNKFKSRVAEVEGWLRDEYRGLRTGRATPALLDSVMVDSYGSKMPIKQIAAISVEEPKVLRVSPWDHTQIGAIETAIQNANLGVSTAPDSTSLRVIFPDLTAETRQRIIKLAKDKMEEARVSLKRERETVWQDVQTKEKDGKISEDEKFRCKNELQKLIDEAHKKFDELFKQKEVEILQ